MDWAKEVSPRRIREGQADVVWFHHPLAGFGKRLAQCWRSPVLRSLCRQMCLAGEAPDSRRSWAAAYGRDRAYAGAQQSCRPRRVSVELEHRDRQRSQVVGAEVLQAQYQRLACHRLLDGVGVNAQLVADGRAYEVGAVAEEALRDQQVDLSQVDEAEVDGDLLGFSALFFDQGSGECSLQLDIMAPSLWMVYGWFGRSDAAAVEGCDPTMNGPVLPAKSVGLSRLRRAPWRTSRPRARTQGWR